MDIDIELPYNSHEVPGKAAAEASWQPESARVSESVEIAVFCWMPRMMQGALPRFTSFAKNLSFCLTEFEIATPAPTEDIQGGLPRSRSATACHCSTGGDHVVLHCLNLRQKQHSRVTHRSQDQIPSHC